MVLRPKPSDCYVHASERATGLRAGGSVGRWIVDTVHLGEAWEEVVEPDEREQVIIVVTAYKGMTWRHGSR